MFCRMLSLGTRLEKHAFAFRFAAPITLTLLNLAKCIVGAAKHAGLDQTMLSAPYPVSSRSQPVMRRLRRSNPVNCGQNGRFWLGTCLSELQLIRYAYKVFFDEAVSCIQANGRFMQCSNYN